MIITSGFLEEQYVKGKKSILAISKEFGLHPQAIRRSLIKFGIKIRSKSETQKISLESGRSKNPTKGIKRSQETKNKISQTLKDRNKENEKEI